MTRSYVKKRHTSRLTIKHDVQNTHQVHLVGNIKVEDNLLEILAYRQNQYVYQINEEYLI